MLTITLQNDPKSFALEYTHAETSSSGDGWAFCETGPGGPTSDLVSSHVNQAIEWFSKNFHSVTPLTSETQSNRSFYTERRVVKSQPSFKQRRLAGEIVMNEYDTYRIDFGQVLTVNKIFSFYPFISEESRQYPFQTSIDQNFMVWYKQYPNEWYSAVNSPIYEIGVGKHPDLEITLVGQYKNMLTYDDGAKKVQLQKMKHNWEVETDVVTDCVAALNGKTLDLLTTLAELPETVNMCWDILKKILLLLIRFKKEAGKKALALFNVEDLRLASPDTYAKLWLQYRYGILPLMYTIEDALKVIENMPNEFIDERKKKVITRPSPLNQEFVETLTHRCLIRRKLNVSTKFKQISNQLSLDPFVTAWELIPLSFVVDWCLTVGNFLAALSTPEGVVSQAASYSVKTECNASNEYSFAEYKFYERILINPQSHISIDISPNMNADRWLDLVSLVKVILMPNERKKYQLI